MTDFKKHNDEDEDIHGLLDSIKQQGTPYSEEPDPLYWANFRVRVMDRVETKQVGFFAKVRTWLMESTMRTSLVGGTLAVLLLGGVYFGTQGDDPPTVATNDPSVSVGSQPATDVVPSDTTVKTPITATPDSRGTVADPAPEMAQATPNEATPVQADRDSAIVNDIAAAAPLLLAENSGPAASLEDMTEAELESLLASIEEMN